MAIGLIKLTYRHIIEANAQSHIECNIFNASYQEFLLRSMPYNNGGNLHTFTQMKARDGRANSLHYKISFASLHFLDDLNNKIPGLLDTLGNAVKYDASVFELVESDITNMRNHKIAVKFITGTFVLHQVIGNNLVLSHESPFNPMDGFAEPFTIALRPDLSITSYKELTNTASVALKHDFNSN